VTTTPTSFLLFVYGIGPDLFSGSLLFVHFNDIQQQQQQQQQLKSTFARGPLVLQMCSNNMLNIGSSSSSSGNGMFRRNHNNASTGGAAVGVAVGGSAANGAGAKATLQSSSSNNRRVRRKQQQHQRSSSHGSSSLPSLACSCLQHLLLKFFDNENTTTLLLIVVMVLLAGGLLHILFQILSVAVHSRRGGRGHGGRAAAAAWPGSLRDHGENHNGRGRPSQHYAHPQHHTTFSPPNLPFHDNLYRIPEAHGKVGDRSELYAQLRQSVDAQLPINDTRSLQAVQRLRLLADTKNGSKNETMTFRSSSRVMDPLSTFYQEQQGPVGGDVVQEPYDVYNCPDTPPKGYPFQWNLVHEVLHDWPVNNYSNDDSIPTEIYNGLCIFDYTKDYDKAMVYRRAELPFVVDNDPHVARTVERWSSSNNYLEQLLGEHVLHRAVRVTCNGNG
jgi:hypothetical protein